MTGRRGRDREELLRAVQNSLPANIAVVAGDGTIIAVNERWEKFARENGDPDLTHTGVGVNYLDVCRRATGPYSEGASDALRGLQAILDGAVDEFEMEYPCPSPTRYRHYFMRAAPLRGERGGFVVAHIDVTDRKLAEQALKESEEKHRTLIERANDGIVVIQDTILKLVNQRFAEMSGYPVEQLLGTPFTDYLTDEEKAFLYDRYRRRMAGEDVPSIYEATLTRSDGSKIDLEINAGVVTYEGRPADLVLFRDVTQRKQAERALRESEERLRALVDNVDAILFRLTPDLRPVMLAGHIESLTGYSAREMMDHPGLWMGRIHSDDVPRVLRETARAAEEHGSAIVEMRIVGRSGEIRWVRSHVTPQFNERGELECYSGVSIDVTDRVLLQEREAEHTARMAALAAISQAFAAALEPDVIIEAAAGRMGEVLGAVGVVASVDRGTGRLSRLSVSCPDPSVAEAVNEALHHTGLSVHSVFGPGPAQPVLYSDVRGVSPEMADFARRVGMGPGVFAPVLLEGEVALILAVTRRLGEEPFDEEDLWFVTETASHASAALTNAYLYRRQSRIAETLQRSLIPAGPKIRGLDIATRYSPATADVDVGGDFFDVVAHDDDVGIVVGDIAGKGLSAAVHTAETKYMLRAFAHEDPDPARVMELLNRALYAYSEEFSFVTLFYGLLRPRDQGLRYLNAGQEVPFVLRARDRSVIRLEPTGLVLGVNPDTTYRTEAVAMAPGDVLFCYTDGVTDVRRNSEMFGHERLSDAVAVAPNSSSDELMEYVISELRAFGRGQQSDDQVMVAVRVLP